MAIVAAMTSGDVGQRDLVTLVVDSLGARHVKGNCRTGPMKIASPCETCPVMKARSSHCSADGAMSRCGK